MTAEILPHLVKTEHKFRVQEIKQLCPKVFSQKDFSRKGAKRCRVSKGFSLRLCAFAGEIFSVEHTFRVKLLAYAAT